MNGKQIERRKQCIMGRKQKERRRVRKMMVMMMRRRGKEWKLNIDGEGEWERKD